MIDMHVDDKLDSAIGARVSRLPEVPTCPDVIEETILREIFQRKCKYRRVSGFKVLLTLITKISCIMILACEVAYY
jgi:hypothetical protein